MSKDAVANLTFTDEQLAEMHRELRFTPVANSSPSHLLAEQVDHYNARGFVSPITVFSEEEISLVRDLFDGWLQAVLASGKDSYAIFTAHKKYPEAHDLICNERIVNYVSDILGDDVIGWGMHFFCKMPRDGKRVAWHQDISYWPLSSAKTCTAWLALDDADTENGCMRFLPASHLHGKLKYRASEDDEQNVLTQTVIDAEKYGEPAHDVELKAGQMSLHSDLLLHGSEANNSDRRRCGVTLRYCSADVRAQDPAWSAKGVIVKGSDSDKHWGNPPRPSAP